MQHLLYNVFFIKESVMKKDQFINIRLTEELKKQVQAHADKEMRTLSSQFIYFVMRGMEKEKPPVQD